MGKGDKPRPLSVSEEEFERRWEKTFSKPEDPDINPAEVDEMEEYLHGKLGVRRVQ